MKTRYSLTRRGSRGDTYYCVDAQTHKRTSLNTSDVKTARRIVEAKNQAELQPAINPQLAKAYLAGTDNGVATRTWQEAIDTLTNMKQGTNKDRWQRAAKDKAFAKHCRPDWCRPECRPDCGSTDRAEAGRRHVKK